MTIFASLTIYLFDSALFLDFSKRNVVFPLRYENSSLSLKDFMFKGENVIFSYIYVRATFLKQGAKHLLCFPFPNNSELQVHVGNPRILEQ